MFTDKEIMTIWRKVNTIKDTYRANDLLKAIGVTRWGTFLHMGLVYRIAFAEGIRHERQRRKAHVSQDQAIV